MKQDTIGEAPSGAGVALRADLPAQMPAELLEAVMGASPTAILLLTPDGSIRLHNSRLTDMWRLPGGTSWVGRPIDAFFDSLTHELSDPTAAGQAFRELSDLENIECRRNIPLRDGRMIECHSAPLRESSSDSDRPGRALFFRDATALRRATDRYRTVARQAPCILYETRVDGLPGWEEDPDGIHNRYASQVEVPDEEAAQRVLPLDVAPGGTYWLIWAKSRYPDDIPQMSQVRAQALTGGHEGWSQIFRCCDRYGATRWLHEVVSIERVGHGRWRTFGVCTDVTELKRVEAALRESEERFTSFMNNCPASAFIKDEAGRMIYLNPAAKAAADLTSDEQWRGKTVRDVLPLETALQFEQNDQRVVHEGRAIEVVEKAPLADGEHEYLVNKFPFFNAAGERFIGGISIDVTDLRRAETSERLQRLLLQTVMEASPTGLLLTSAAGERLLVNRPYYEMWGMPEDVARDSARALEFEQSHVVNPQQYMARILELRANPKERAIETVALKDGRTFLRTSGPIQSDRYLGRLIGFQDVTEQERDKQQLRSLAWEQARAEERERRRIAVMLHDDVGQTLTVALLAVARLKDRMEPGAANELEQLSKLVDTVLETTRSLTVQLSPPVLYELGLPAALRWLGTQLLEPRGIAVRTTIDVASAVSEQVRVVAFNAVRELYLNILKHSKARTVELSVQEQAGLLHATILDNGIGLDPSRWRAAPTREDHFGLFNLREQLRHMGGSMELQSEIGHFTRVRLTLPLNVETTSTTKHPGDSYGQHS